MSVRNANILDPIHKTLDPRVWDKAGASKPLLKPRHAHWVKKQVYAVLDQGGYTDPEKWLTLVVTGSLTTYQYSDDSDFDVSLFVDSKAFPEWSRAELIALMVDQLDDHMLPGTPFPIQCFVVPHGIDPHDLYKPGERSGYNLDNNKWIIPPEKDRVQDVESTQNGFYTWALQVADKMERLMRYEPKKAVDYYHSIHERRKRDMAKGKGDFAESNIVYKFLAKRGLLPKVGRVADNLQPLYEEMFDLAAKTEEQIIRGNYNDQTHAWGQRYHQIAELIKNHTGEDPRPYQHEGAAHPQGFTDMYHVSPRRNRKGIEDTGFRGGDLQHTSPHAYEWNQPAGNYFFDNPSDAENYSFSLADRSGVKGDAVPEHELYEEEPEQPDNWEDMNEEEQDEWYDEHGHQELQEDPKGWDIWKVDTRGLPMFIDPEAESVQHWNRTDPERKQYADKPWDLGRIHDELEADPEKGLEDYGTTPRRYVAPLNIQPNRGEVWKHMPRWEMRPDEEEGLWDETYPEEVPEPWTHVPMTEWPLPGHESKTAAPWNKKPQYDLYDLQQFQEAWKDPKHPLAQPWQPSTHGGYGSTPKRNRSLDLRGGLDDIGGYSMHLMSNQHSARAPFGALREMYRYGHLNEEQFDKAISEFENYYGERTPFDIPAKEFQNLRVDRQDYLDKTYQSDPRLRADQYEQQVENANNFAQRHGVDPLVMGYTHEQVPMEEPQVVEEKPPVWSHVWRLSSLHDLIDKVFHGIMEGGITINLAGEEPTKRYGFAPDKSTEEKVHLEELTPMHVEEYIQDHLKELSEPEKYLGTWIKEGFVWLDVTESHDDYNEAFERAWKGQQQAMYDSVTGEDIPVRGYDYYPEQENA